MKKIFYIVLMALTLMKIGCSKDELREKPISQVQIWKCYKSKTWDENKIFDLLVGKWKWIYSESYSDGIGTSTENENMIVEFFSDSTLLVSVNNRTRDTIKWIVVPKDGDLFGVKCDSSIAQLQGRILNCGDILEFNNSYIDGVDNYFERMGQDTVQTKQLLF